MHLDIQQCYFLKVPSKADVLLWLGFPLDGALLEPVNYYAYGTLQDIEDRLSNPRR